MFKPHVALRGPHQLLPTPLAEHATTGETYRRQKRLGWVIPGTGDRHHVQRRRNWEQRLWRDVHILGDAFHRHHFLLRLRKGADEARQRGGKGERIRKTKTNLRTVRNYV